MKSVILIASRTIDYINNLDLSIQLKRPGGPALYCKRAMDDFGYRVHLITTSRPTQVFITIRGGHESIRIDRVPKIRLKGHLPSRNVVLSPILGEFNLEKLTRRQCRIFLDAQGYVRAVGEDQTQVWSCDPRNLKNVIVLKVNQRESSYVPDEILDLLRERILLITHGKEGVEVWERGSRHMVRGKEILTPDTLGAGDTFFGSFVAAFLEAGDAKTAAKIAITKAEQLLKRK